MKPLNFPLKAEEAKIQFNEEITRPQGPFRIGVDKQNSKNVYKKYGEWTPKQNVKYAAFIHKNFVKLQGKPHKLLWNQYIKMAEFIQTRNFRQCKSHHHQLCQQYQSIKNILIQLKNSNKKFNQHFELELIRIELQAKLQNQKTSKNIQSKEHKNDKNCVQLKYSSILDSFKQRTSDKYFSQKQEEWLECHRLFIQWTTKLKQLMLLQSKSQSQQDT